MKLLRTQTRVETDDALGMAIEIAVIMVLFIGGGFALDRWLGTLPLFMIVGTLLGSVGLFTKHKYRYDAKMLRLEAERRAAIGARNPQPRTGSVGGTDG
jgi:F0F1-type ATP synthase assembly protein I